MRFAAISPSEDADVRQRERVGIPTLEDLVRDLLAEILAETGFRTTVVVAGAGTDPVGCGSGLPDSEVRSFVESFEPPGSPPVRNGIATMVLPAGPGAAALATLQRPVLLTPPQARTGDLVVVVDGDPEPAEARRIVDAMRRALPLTAAALELRSVRSRLLAAERAAALARAALHALPDAVVVTYASADTMHLNDEAARLVGGDPDRSSPPPQVPDGHGNGAALAALVEDLWRRGPGERKVTLVDPGDARRVPMLAKSRWVTDGRDGPSAIVTQLHDLGPEVRSRRLACELEKLNARLAARVLATTREVAERNARLERQATDLERASRVKSEFLTMVSHELRTPINAVLGYAALLEEGVLGPLDGEQREVIERMRQAAGRLTRMINDTLDLARVEAGLVRIQEGDVDVARCLRDMSTAVREEAADKGLEYHLEIAEDLPPVRSDEARLRQLLNHLLDNAVKFTETGAITLRALPAGGGEGVRIEVADTGIGIPTEHLASIFDDFTQVDQSSTRAHGGAGLGLAICSKLVTVLGGRLGVSSELGRGTTFRLVLPVNPELAPLPAPPEADAVRGDRPRRAFSPPATGAERTPVAARPARGSR